jgi:hypothetical protein
MAMMEKYANNLEALVDERTDQLVEEKKKTGNIYHIMERGGGGRNINSGSEHNTQIYWPVAPISDSCLCASSRVLLSFCA